jgi:Tetratricopeptide Repeats-Sensor
MHVTGQSAGWPAAEWRTAVGDAERHGEHLTAFDLAERGLEEHPADAWLRHRAVLALARAGSTEEARRRFVDYRLDTIEDEDVAALRARIEKDAALAAHGQARTVLAARAAAVYEQVFARTGGYYSGINAATLAMFAGDAGHARALAAKVLHIAAGTGAGSYYGAATEAEARLLLADPDAAAEALGRAAELHGGDYAAVAATRRQLRLVCAAMGQDAAVVDVLPTPAVVHYCGHRLGADSESVARRIADEVAARRPAVAYGALASGADIVWAEALLAGGADLHVVLPFARDAFVHASVADAGEAWVARFERCLRAASSVRYGTENAFERDDSLYRYGSDLAMGLTVLHARSLDAQPCQLTVWDGRPRAGTAGTAADVAAWRRGGRSTAVVEPDAGATEPAPAAPPGGRDGVARSARAMLFGDVRGFSQLTDEQLVPFARAVLGAFAGVLERFRRDVLYRNTWGDGLYVVLADAATAASCALALQDAVHALDLERESLPSDLALRLGGHIGPIFEIVDPVLGTTAFMGAHVSRTARIEPVTPPGVVYVTEPFAAALALDGDDRFSCDYVGHMPAAKGYARLRMYTLRAVSGAA